jgi:hypothetical protein
MMNGVMMKGIRKGRIQQVGKIGLERLRDKPNGRSM